MNKTTHDTSPSKSCDLLVCGGGVPGLTLALLLGDAGLRVTVIDPNPPRDDLRDIRPDGRTAALMAGSVNILKATGAWDACAKHGAALRTLRIVEGDSRVDFHAGDIGLPCFGVNIANTVLRAGLAARMRNHKNIDFHPTAIAAFKADDFGTTATLKNGATLRVRLIVGADGRNAATRALAGIGVREIPYGQRAITCLIAHTKPHEGISTEFHRPGGPFTLVPMPGNLSSVVWVEYESDAEQFMTMRRADFEKAIQDRTENALGRITLETSPEGWPLKGLRADDLTAPRLALMAEAAHVVHPLGAQGLNLSLRDAAALAEEITDAARRGQDIGARAVLDRYRFRRRADIMTRSFGTDSLTRMVSNDIGLLRGLRQAGLKTIETLEPLRRFAMHEGVTPGYDDSRLSRGEPL